LLDAQPVEVINQSHPVPVKIVESNVPLTPPVSYPSLPPTTTDQQDITTAAQRKINLIWEYTQATIAISVIVVSMIAAIIAMLKQVEVSAFLSFVCGNVVGFYFSRTNHAAICVIGPKPQEMYLGR
jgi:hypothetical protein